MMDSICKNKAFVCGCRVPVRSVSIFFGERGYALSYKLKKINQSLYLKTTVKTFASKHKSYKPENSLPFLLIFLVVDQAIVTVTFVR